MVRERPWGLCQFLSLRCNLMATAGRRVISLWAPHPEIFRSHSQDSRAEREKERENERENM